MRQLILCNMLYDTISCASRRSCIQRFNMAIPQVLRKESLNILLLLTALGSIADDRRSGA